MDSMLLLHLMSELFPGRIRAIYINHQLQTISNDWAKFVVAQCHSLNIPFIVENVQVAEGNLENQAREARYQAFLQHLQPNEILVLAHHQQDQAETLMLRLLSGAGVSGLAAMKSLDIREQLTIWRPLLDVSREQICQWVKEQDIAYVDDPTNLDTHYDRAWCRQELWHILQSRFPAMQQALSRTTLLMQDAEHILNEVLHQDLANCGNAQRLELTKLQQLSLPRQRQLLSMWMKGQQQYRPALDMVQRIQSEVIEARQDAQAALHCNGYYYLRYQKYLYRLEHAVYQAQHQHRTVLNAEIALTMGQRLQVAAGDFQISACQWGLNPELLNRTLLLSDRQGGEKIHLNGRVGSWPLKKAIQQAQIFPWLRHTIQILHIDNVMLGVFTPIGFWLASSEYCVEDGWQPDLISLE